MGNRQFTDDISGPDWVLVRNISGRRDFRFYLLLGFGLVFALAGATIDPATNCDESGECAPWLVPVAFWMGVLASLAGITGIVRNLRRGSGINLRTGELVWWNEVHASASGRLKLDDVATIRVDERSESSTLRLFDSRGELMPFPGAEVTPGRLEDWAKAVEKIRPQIRIEIAD